MSTLPSVRSLVRNAVVEYLSSFIVKGNQANAPVPYLSNVYGFPAKVTNEGEFYDIAGVGAGASIWLYFPNEVDKRYEITADFKTTGQTGKAVEFELRLLCLLRSGEQTAQGVGEAAEAFLDGLLNVIRADPNAGTGEDGNGTGVIWSWGLGSFPNGGPDLHTEQTFPRPIRSGVTDVQSIVEVTVVSLIDPQIS